jgi:hypothetical protein
MKNMSKHLLSVFFIINLFGAKAQWTEISIDEYTKMIEAIEQKIPRGISYGYEAKYLFFEEAKSTDIIQSFEFSCIYNAKQKLFNIKQFEHEIIQNADIQIICDPVFKQIVVNKPMDEYFDFGSMNKIMSSEVNSVKKQIKGKIQMYSVEFIEGHRFKAAEIWVNETGMICKYILFTSDSIMDDTLGNERLIQPRMEIQYFNYQVGKAAEELKLKTVDFYFLDLTQKLLTQDYNDFEIIDLRN